MPNCRRVACSAQCRLAGLPPRRQLHASVFMSRVRRQGDARRKLNRRAFVCESALATAGAAFALTATKTVLRRATPRRKIPARSSATTRRWNTGAAARPNMMISAVCLGGHWKRIDKVLPPKPDGQGWLNVGAGVTEFDTNRREVVSRCIERGINYIDACWANEVIAYSKALEGRRDKMYLGFSWGITEVRFPEWRTFEKLKQGFEEGLRDGQAGVCRPVADHVPGRKQPT